MRTRRTPRRRSKLNSPSEELHLSVDQVARAVGVDPKTVWRWETGENNPYRRQCPAIARTLRWPLAATVQSSRSLEAVADLRTRLKPHDDSPPVAEFFDVADALLPA